MNQIKKSFSILFALAFLASSSFGSWVELAPTLPECEMVLAPETITPEDNISLGIKHLVSNLDAKLGYLPFFVTKVKDNKIVSEHSGWDYVDISARYLEALWLERSVTGDMTDFERELNLRKTLLSYRGTDGLFYRQKSEFYPYHEAHTADQASALRFLVEVYRDTRSGEVKKIIEVVIAGLQKKAEKTKQGYKFACPTYGFSGKCGQGTNLFHKDPIQFFARLSRTIEDFHLLAPDSALAKDMSSGLLKYILRESKVFNKKDWGFDGQAHSRISALIGLYNYAQETGDEKLADFVKNQVWFLFNHAATFGWVPEVIDRGNPKNPKTLTSETCAVVDFLELVMMLSKKDPLFWEMADQIVRNQLVEAQLYNKDILPKGLSGDDRHKLLGAFCGYCSVNSWSDETMECCSASGVRGWALVWKNAITRDSSGSWINLSLNRATEDVVVTSEIPHRGRVTVEAKRAGTFYLRVPVWVVKGDVKVNNELYKGKWKKQWYLELNAKKAGERFIVDYLLPDRETYLTVGETKYTVIWKGNAVIKIEPQSKIFPTYDREHLGLRAFKMVPKKLCWQKGDRI